MMMTTQGPEATEAIARLVGKVAAVGDVILLEGELGAGKTAFTRGLAAGLGHDPRLVSSPTFVVMNRYATANEITLTHMDAYRLGGADELDTLGFDEVIDSDTVLAIEWPQRIAARLAEIDAKRITRVSLEHVGEEERRLTIDAAPSWRMRPGFGALVAAMGAAGVGGERVMTKCPATGEMVGPDSPTWPFASERARLADLHKWLTGGYVISREIRAEDDVEG